MKVLVLLSDDESTAAALRGALDDFEIRHRQHGDEAERADFLFLDLDALAQQTALLGVGQSDALQEMRRQYGGALVVVLAPPARLREAVGAVKAGADDYVLDPVDATEVRLVLSSAEEAARMRSELTYLRDAVWGAVSDEPLHTRSPLMKAAMAQAKAVAPTRTTVLLTGETGTGKGVFARLIHRWSNRNVQQFIAVHCGAIPEALLESELFGYEKGAFTGATRRKRGKFEIAGGGTIFLDEIGTTSGTTQIKLLQVLQEQRLQRLGSEQDLTVDVRVISATNDSLEALCDAGKFRRDLFYRLNVFPIALPSLRRRQEDIEPLTEFFVELSCRQLQKHITGIDSQVLDAFAGYSWPGNIRELQNVVERACILETGRRLSLASLPVELALQRALPSGQAIAASETLAIFRQRSALAAERQYLQQVLARNHGRIAAASRDAGVGPRQLHKLMQKHGLRKEDFKA